MKRSTHPNTLALEVSERDHIQGPSNAQVTLVEYGDYQCPYCGEAYYIIKDVQRQMAENMRFVFRNFPLTTIHPYAEPAAEAAEAAGAQGKFWEVHDYLYEHQSELGPEQLIVAGATLGLHTRRYTEELIRHVYAERIREDILSGVLSGITGTPTFFINGVRHDGSYDFDMLVGAINAHLKQRAA
jgi:protein-disulfide isomerase